jgi:hypothetical protein
MTERNKLFLLGFFTIGIGAAICLVGLDVIPVDPDTKHAPAWVISLCGGVFVFAGLAIVLQGYPVIVSVLGNLIVASFAAIAAWVAFFGAAGEFSGGLPFVSSEINVSIARGVFAFGALICALILIPGIKHLRKLISEQ